MYTVHVHLFPSVCRSKSEKGTPIDQIPKMKDVSKPKRLSTHYFDFCTCVGMLYLHIQLYNVCVLVAARWERWRSSCAGVCSASSTLSSRSAEVTSRLLADRRRLPKRRASCRRTAITHRKSALRSCHVTLPSTTSSSHCCATPSKTSVTRKAGRYFRVFTVCCLYVGTVQRIATPRVSNVGRSRVAVCLRRRQLRHEQHMLPGRLQQLRRIEQ